MRILHVITRLILGGAQQNTILSCRAQVEAGHEVILAHGRVYGPEGTLLEEARATGARLLEVPAMRRAPLPMHDARCYRALRRIVREWAPDVVHTHSSKAGILGRAAAWAEGGKSGRPGVVHTVHGLAFHERQRPAIRRGYVLAERWAAGHCHRLIAVTAAMVEAFVENGIAQADRFTVIPSGIDLRRFHPRQGAGAAARARLGIAPGAPVVGIVARLDPLKGHEDLLAILDPLAARFPGLRYLFVGGGWASQRIQRHPAVRAGRVVLAGLTPPGDIPDMLAAMDVKVLPSHQEGQSRTLAEALVCGVPIVAYDVGGMGAVCIDGRTGKLVPRGDLDALADAIAWTLEHRDAAHAMAAAGAEHVRKKFDAEAMVRKIEAVYKTILK